MTAATPSKTVMMVSGGVACVPHVDPAQRGNQVACRADTVRRYRAGAASGLAVRGLGQVVTSSAWWASPRPARRDRATRPGLDGTDVVGVGGRGPHRFWRDATCLIPTIPVSRHAGEDDRVTVFADVGA